MEYILYPLIGYLLGAISPAALIAKLKRKDLRENGTGNLGATNTMLVFGRTYGVAVMLFDIAKAFFAFKLAEWAVPEAEWLALAAGACAVVGHCFPFYLKFKGGKGLATFGGLVLAYEPWLFAFLLVTGVLLMILVNHSFILPFYATLFFAVYAAIREENILSFLCVALVSVLILVMAFEQLIRAVRGQDGKIREYIKTKLFRRGKSE